MGNDPSLMLVSVRFKIFKKEYIPISDAFQGGFPKKVVWHFGSISLFFGLLQTRFEFFEKR